MKRKLVLASLVLILAFALPVSAFAGGLQEGRVVFGGTYTLHDGETLDGDLAVLGGAAFLEQGSTVDGDVIHEDDLPAEIQTESHRASNTMQAAVEEAEKAAIAAALADCDNHRERTAKLLDVSVRTLQTRCYATAFIE